MTGRMFMMILPTVLLFLTGQMPARAQETRITEVTMAAPDIIAVEVRDGAFLRGRIIELPEPRMEEVGRWIRRGSDWGMVLGRERRHLRISDIAPADFLDRGLADDAKNYRLDGKARVEAVYRKSMPYDSGFYMSASGDSRTGASFKHLLFLKLDRALEPGRHRIEWPGAMLPPTSFDFDPSSTRALAIHATQAGHAPADLSKLAFFSLWLPGGADEGAVDFRRYGLHRFSVLDARGEAVFSGDIRLRSTPLTAEPWNGQSRPLLDYASLQSPRRAITGLRRGDIDIVTAPDHGFHEGERVLLERLGGDQDAAGAFATIGSVTKDTFEIRDVEGVLPSDGARPGATAVRTHSANRAGTYIFELDYSRWVPSAPGDYRIRVDGLGVSDTFAISDGVWRRIAGNAIAGLYHHRSGIALDGRFGYRRPVAFRPGAGIDIVDSKLPLSLSSEWPGGFMSFTEGPKEAWRGTKAISPDAWGGYMDAGDWDRRIQHLQIATLFLDLADLLPEDRLALPLGIPKSSEVLEHPLYKSADGLPDLVHEAIWGVDFYRRLQEPDGLVRGGIESASHPLLGTASFLEHQTVFAYGPDVTSTFYYAAAAARLARTLKRFGQAELADLFEKSAVSAWAAAEKGLADLDGFYAEARDIAISSGLLAGADWPARRAVIERYAGEHRIAAAAALFRLTGEGGYRAIAESALRSDWDLYEHKADAAWDYMRSDGADPALRQKLETTIKSEMAALLEAQASHSYPSMKHPYAPAGWGQDGVPGCPMALLAIRAHILTRDDAIIRLMQQTLNGALGANQPGISLMTGIGARQIAHPLHEDHRAMGVEAPAGIVVYGWAPVNAFAYGWVFGPFWSALPEVGTQEHAANRRIEPSRFALPYFENLVEHPSVIIQQEYTVHQTIAPVAAIALYLDVNGQGTVH